MALPGSESANLLTQRGIGAVRDIAISTGNYDAVFGALKEKFPSFSGSARSAVARQLIASAEIGSEFQNLPSGSSLSPGDIPRNPNIEEAYRYNVDITYFDPVRNRDVSRRFFLNRDDQLTPEMVADQASVRAIEMWARGYQQFKGLDLPAIGPPRVALLGIERRD